VKSEKDKEKEKEELLRQTSQQLLQGMAALVWTKVNCLVKDGDENHRPKPRSCHTMTVIGTNGFLFGGMADNTANIFEEEYDVKPSNEIFKLDLSNKAEVLWIRLRTGKSPTPPARWRHSATLFENTQILIFGGFHTTDHRLNDVWIFDTVGCTWSQPNPKHNQEAAVPCQLSNSEWSNVPSPRGGHSATLVGELVYVFGGYGGMGYSRRDMDDLYALNIYTWVWTKLNPKGLLPEKRSGHQAVAVERKVFVFGGANSSVQLNDLFVLDTEMDPPVWTKMNTSLPAPTWNLCGCSVIAIPTWKIFTFGGITGPLNDSDRMGKSSNAISILDTGIGRWQHPKVEGESPSPRSDCSMSYDAKGSRLLVFGGWNDDWMNDLYSLDVGNIVGPPYAITDMFPNIGPVTGGTEITIIGIDFINTTNIIVRFGNARASVDVPGMFVSQSKITCVSPVSKFPPGEVEVRVSLEGDSFTTTFQKFSYFPVTNFATCVMYGPGLLSGCVVGEEVSFYIQARDDNNHNRTTGGDEFNVVILAMGAGEEGENVRLHGVMIEDLENGKYLVTYKVKFPGKYEVRADFLGTFGGKAGELRGSGVVIDFQTKAPRDNNQMTGQLMNNALKHDIEYLHSFLENVSKTVLVRVRDDSWSSDEQIQVLMRIKEALMLIEAKYEEINLLVDRSECVIHLFQSENLLLDTLEESLFASKYLWEKVAREAPVIQTKIAPMMRSHNSKIKNDIQSYEARVNAYKGELMKSDFYLYATGTEKAIELIKSCQRAYEEEKKSCDRITHTANIFDCVRDMDASNRTMKEIEDLLSEFMLLWEGNMKVVQTIDDAKRIIWQHLDPEALEDSAKGLVQFLRKLPKSVRGSDAFQGLDRHVKEFVITCPIIASLRSPAMRDRHWQELMEIVKQQFVLPSNQPNMPLKQLLELNLHKHANEVDEITEKATKEAKHEDALKNLNATWSAVDFTMNFYKDTDVPLLKLDDDTIEQLESDQMAVQSIVGGRYAFFKREAGVWQKVLGMISDVYQILSEIQRLWSYLEPLFIGSEEVKKELPDDAKRFELIDAQVRSILQKAWKIRNVKNVCNQAGLLEQLNDLSLQQEQCKKSLSDFLDGKRRQFPRFYFMSEADLLTLLSNSSTPSKVLALIDKILLATSAITITNSASQDRPSATHFVAGVGKEQVQFEPAVKLTGKAEQYLLLLLKAQIFTLSKALASSMSRYSEQIRIQWVNHRNPKTGETVDPAQIILLVAAVDFCQQVEKSMAHTSGGDGRAMQKCYDLVKSQLADLINLTQTNLTKGDRQRVMCMITLDAHNRDIIEVLLKDKAFSVSDFQWQSKLRPSFIAEVGKSNTSIASNARFHICDASFDYGFEYLGNGPRLVVTPLTDRIYVTATQALHLKMGCAPAGPAGTGKTETTKDLASALGKCCYVFNCSPEMDYQSMGNIFKGLSASGSWGCFDEFNRLIPEVLSVCSVQFKAVCDGLRVFDKTDANTHRVTIEGDTVGLDPTCGAFITMNPGYLGRSELPEGLKALFRPITVIVPDLVLICENMMMAEGFLSAKSLASKFYGLYSLLSELLSKQSHYDWGLRAVKSVLVVAGQLKRAEPLLDEESLLMRALRDFNIPKIVQADEVVFFGLLNDLFPGLNPPRIFDEELSECVTIACENQGLWADPFFTLKVMQLDELLDIRHCVFVMGPPGAGKSTCWKTLQAARNHQKPDQKVKVVDLNPKVLPTEELYGHISMATREWKDGLLSNIMRDLGRIPNEHPKWMILDGDLDANWIESMNSVMDDNKMLTLASNERIPLKSHMRMIFEIRDLKFATPATVSRAGILYISTDEGNQWRSIVGSWVRNAPDSLLQDSDRENVHNMFEKYLPSTLKYFATDLQAVVQCNDISLCISILRLLNTMLTREIVVDPAAFETVFVFCVIWGFGSVLTVGDDGTDFRKNFSEWFRGKFKSIKIPSRDTIFDYWLDPRTSKFESWKVSPGFKTVEFNSTSMNMASVTVPTAETASVSFWLDLLVKAGNHVMLAGGAGTGKTQLVVGMLSQLEPENHIHTTVNMNFYTSASVLLSSLEPVLQKRTGTTYGPPGSAKMVYFIDDLNLPEVDPYGTQSAIALLRQHIDYGHWYDTQKLSLKTVDDCQYVAALNPTAGSFSINPRLQRHFTCFAVGMPSATSLLTIYQTFLDGHLSSQNFNHSVMSISSTLIKGALAVHKEVSETFRKTAANFHYEFNIRHLANVFQGLLVATSVTFKDPEKFVFLWLHESERVYGDRLVDYDDLDKFKKIMQNQAKKAFPQYNIARFYLSGGGVKADPLVFCHFSDGTTRGGDELAYDQALNMNDLRTTLEQSLEEYNEMNAAMNLVLFDDAVLHVARIIRIVKQTGGHALLVGVGGSGKQSLSKLAAHVCGFTVMQIVVNQNYSLLDFRTDIQGMYNKAGIKQEGVMFMLADSQISNEKFLVYLNDLLSSGNIPDLYSKDERESIINSLTNKAKAAGYSSEPASVWSYFISKIRENLHCCLCFSPVGNGLRVRARRFPALANCTVIDWFQPWPEQALASVGKKVLSQMDLGSPEVTKAIEHYMPTAFLAVNKACKVFASAESKYVYTTPKSYLEMLQLYRKMLRRKREENGRDVQRLQHGIEKLQKAASDVVELEDKLKIMLESAEEKRKVAEEIAKNVQREKDVVEAENQNAKVEEAKVATIQAEVSAKQEDAARDLAQAEPALMRAMEALNSLDKKDLGACKTMNKAPPGVEDIFGAVVVLLAGINPNVIVQKSGKVREKDRTWDAAKKALLGNVNGFLEELHEFKRHIDDNTVPEINLKEVRPFLVLDHFNPDIIMSRNSAAAGLCSWVINIVNYYDIVLTVEPKRVALRQATDQLNTANEQLNEVRKRVETLQARLDVLTRELAEAEVQRKEAQDTAERGKMKLELANRLTTALGSEQTRWSEGIESLKYERDLLVGDCLLASTFISYIGPFTKAYRESLIDETLTPLLTNPPFGAPVPLTVDMEIIGLMCTEAEIAEYQTQGLPADRVSAENAAIVLNSARYPLLVDPQLQAIRWIKKREGKRLQIGRMGEKDLINRILKAIEEGNPFLIENMGENIDPSLMPIVARIAVKKGKRRVLHIGDAEVEISPDFRLYLHTKLSNPHYPPEIQAETTLVNFSVTQDGLEEQLLALVVKFERPDLAAQRAALILQQNLFTIKVKQLEDQILVRLAEAQGDITENRQLIEELELSKKISDEIAVKLEESKVTSEKINTTSEKYRPVSRRGALLFFVMNSLYKMHTYYMYSLTSFVFFFLRGIALASSAEGELDEAALAAVMDDGGQSKEDNVDLTALGEQIVQRVEEIEERDRIAEGTDLSARLNQLKSSLTRVVFDYVRMGLFEKDKLTVSTLVTFAIMVDEGSLNRDFVAVFTRGRSSDEVAPRGPELSSWLSEIAWNRLKGLEEDLGHNYSIFHDLTERLAADAEDWEEWFNRVDPEEHDFPGDFMLLRGMERLLLLRILRPDRLPVALRSFVIQHLGEEYINQPPFSMSQTYQFTSPHTPCLFVLYPGVDPTSWVEDYGASAHGVTTEAGNFVNISMGQGQEERANRTLTRLSETGGWLFLQNVHLMQTWLPSLEEKMETLVNPHPQFRVFISAEPPPLTYMKNVPEGLMQSCVTVSNEPPSDLKANMNRAWASFSQQRIDGCDGRTSTFQACLFGLSFFHALMLGRRRFGFQGWSRAYGFNMGDLRICADVLESYLKRGTAKGKSGRHAAIPWQDFRYIFGEIMYGGHITDWFDRRTNNTYLSVIFNESLLQRPELGPKLVAPDPQAMDYNGYNHFIHHSLPPESPNMYGLHPNAEIGFLTNNAESLCQSIYRLYTLSQQAQQQSSGAVSSGGEAGGASGKDGLAGGAGGAAATAGGDGSATAGAGKDNGKDAGGAGKGASGNGGAGGASSAGALLRESLNDLLRRCPPAFNLVELSQKIKPHLTDSDGPFVVVLMQECTRISALIEEMLSSLDELQKGLNGQLNMSTGMEDMAQCLELNMVPGRNPFHVFCNWERLAWASRKSLSSWFSDLILRRQQLAEWARTLQLPYSVWLPGLINPTALLTAIKQVTARKRQLPLDSMALDTHVTRMYRAADAIVQATYPEDGAYVHGLMLEGARWTDDEESAESTYTVGNVTCAGTLHESRLKQLLSPMPVMYVRAVPVQPTWSPESVGYLRRDPALYECPVYFTSARGPTFVFLAVLKTKDSVHRWILAGVALLLQSDD
jgi:dynein heavy chain